MVQIFKFRERKNFENVFCEVKSREPEIENEKFFKNQDSIHIHAHAHTRESKNLVYFQMCDAIKYRMMLFKPIFSPVERFL